MEISLGDSRQNWRLLLAPPDTRGRNWGEQGLCAVSVIRLLSHDYQALEHQNACNNKSNISFSPINHNCM